MRLCRNHHGDSESGFVQWLFSIPPWSGANCDVLLVEFERMVNWVGTERLLRQLVWHDTCTQAPSPNGNCNWTFLCARACSARPSIIAGLAHIVRGA